MLVFNIFLVFYKTMVDENGEGKDEKLPLLSVTETTKKLVGCTVDRLQRTQKPSEFL